ncbi:MAG: hypothetical protein PUB34_06510 [Clostridia bacterium]|nr:hypothetical protein [Clostridia bacterium]
MGMIWAYNASTEIGDTKVMYNPYEKTYILASCTKDDIGFIELYSGSMEEMEEMEKYESEHRTERNNRYSGGFRLGNRLDIGNDDFSENGGDEEGNVRFSSGAETRKQIVGGTNDNGQTVADPENRKAENKETSNKIAAEDDLRYLEAVKNGDMATVQAMVDQAAREKGYVLDTSICFLVFSFSISKANNNVALVSTLSFCYLYDNIFSEFSDHLPLIFLSCLL